MASDRLKNRKAIVTGAGSGIGAATAVRLEIVVFGNYFKFPQIPDLRQLLMDTGDLRLAEAAPTDQV